MQKAGFLMTRLIYSFTAETVMENLQKLSYSSKIIRNATNSEVVSQIDRYTAELNIQFKQTSKQFNSVWRSLYYKHIHILSIFTVLYSCIQSESYAHNAYWL